MRGGQQVSDGYIDELTTFLGPGTLGHGETGPLQRYDWVWIVKGSLSLVDQMTFTSLHPLPALSRDTLASFKSLE